MMLLGLCLTDVGAIDCENKHEGTRKPDNKRVQNKIISRIENLLFDNSH